MTPAQFAIYVRKKTRTNSTTFTDAEILAFMQVRMDDIAKEIIKVNEDYFGFWLTRNLVADQRNYTFNTDMLSQMKFLEAQLDGTDWEVLREYDNNTLRINTDESSILLAMANIDPGYFIFGGELIILNDAAIVNVTDGLKLWSILYPTHPANLAGTDDMSIRVSATSVGFPRQFHELLSRSVIVDWKESQDKPIPLTQSEKMYQNDLQSALDSLKNLNLDRSIQATVPYDDGEEY